MMLGNWRYGHPRRAGRRLLAIVIRLSFESGQEPMVLFASFWHAGFESASHRNSRGIRVDMIAATQHVEQAEEDYARLPSLDIRVAHEGIRWHLVEQGDRFNFASIVPVMDAASRHGVQVIWSLCHYGWPDDLDIFSPEFVTRFARYGAATAEFIAHASDAIPVYAPFTEISFLAYAAGEVGTFYPYARGRGDELKAQLVRAAIAGIEAIWRVDPRARIVHVDSVINVVPPRDRPDLAELADRHTASQFAAWDWLVGRARPDLGGHPRYLDIVGVNFYHYSQWEYPEGRLRWEEVPRDPRWVPFHQLLAGTYARYHRPVFVAETSYDRAGKGRWICEIAAEVARSRESGVSVEGICLYPIIDRPDWDVPQQWHHSGLWDLVPDRSGRLQRVLVEEYAAGLAEARSLVEVGGAEQARNDHRLLEEGVTS